jgi:hypothetical protein
VVCDPAKSLKPASGGATNEAIYEVPQGIDPRIVLCVLNGTDDPKAVGGVITTVWYHGSAALVVPTGLSERERGMISAVCRLAGAQVFDSFYEAIDEARQKLGIAFATSDFDSDEGDEPEDTQRDPNELVMRLPSGNEIVVKYFGRDESADKIMLFSRAAGGSDAPLNLDMVVPDPDREMPPSVKDGVSYRPVEMHRVNVRHHGPTDSGQGTMPTDFLPPNA